jgi:DNA polymerase
VCLSKYLRKNYPEIFKGYGEKEDTVNDFLSPKNWKCTMIHSRYLSLPSSLDDVGKVLRIENRKMSEGKALIRYFCVPYEFENGIPKFHPPKNSPEKWEIFKSYNIQDVLAELEIDKKLSKFPVPEFVWEEFYLDQKINDRGILVDTELVKSAIYLDNLAKEKLSVNMKNLTGIENPNSVYQLLIWQVFLRLFMRLYFQLQQTSKSGF